MSPSSSGRGKEGILFRRRAAFPLKPLEQVPDGIILLLASSNINKNSGNKIKYGGAIFRFFSFVLKLLEGGQLEF